MYVSPGGMFPGCLTLSTAETGSFFPPPPSPKPASHFPSPAGQGPTTIHSTILRGVGGGRCSLEGVFLAPPHTPSCQPLDLETFFHLLPPNHQPQLSPTRRWPSLPPTLRPPSCKEGGGLACVSCLGLQADSDTAASKSPFCCLATTCDLRT